MSSTLSSALEPPGPTSRRDPERGGILMVAMIALVALLGIGVVTMLSVRSDTAASGSDRFRQVALYAAESGAAAAMDYLRNNCNTVTLFSAFVEPNNENPQVPLAILGNSKEPGEAGNPFAEETHAWYRATVLNNQDDPGLAAGADQDGIVMLEITGFGPANTQTTLRVGVQSPSCIEEFCAYDYAQRGVNAQNTTVAICAKQVDLSSGLQVFTP